MEPNLGQVGHVVDLLLDACIQLPRMTHQRLLTYQELKNRGYPDILESHDIRKKIGHLKISGEPGVPEEHANQKQEI